MESVSYQLSQDRKSSNDKQEYGTVCNNNIIFIQGKPLQCRNTIINGDPVKLRWIKLRLILPREDNRRTQRKTLEAWETNYNNSICMSSKFLTISTRLYPGGHPSSYNSIWPGFKLGVQWWKAMCYPHPPSVPHTVIQYTSSCS